MLYEIDFLPVGEGEKSGDAICLRYSDDNGETWRVGVIDGGTIEVGEKLCDHIKKYYETDEVDFLFCSHPDQDHASGLSVVLENLKVNEVLMHCPWDYVDYIFDYVSDGRVTKESLRNRLIEGHPYAYKVYEIAKQKKIPIYHAFSDKNDHNIPYLTIVGPSFNYYLQQLINFRSITEVTEEIKESALETLLKAAKKTIKWISETWDKETLVDPEDDATSSENNSSTILHFDFGGKYILFTADAGVPALNEACDFMENNGILLQNFSMFQVPHHGSKRNIGPTILDRLIGGKLPENTQSKFSAIISAAKDGDPKHPNKRVVNALIRRGAKVVTTQGATICHHSSGTPDRGWEKAEPLPFYDKVEEEE